MEEFEILKSAIKNNTIETVRDMVSQYDNIDSIVASLGTVDFGRASTNIRGNNLLHEAALKGRLEIVTLLIEKSSIHVITGLNAQKENALMLACESGNLELFRYLVATEYFDMTSKNNRQEGLFFFAVRSNNYDMFQEVQKLALNSNDLNKTACFSEKELNDKINQHKKLDIHDCNKYGYGLLETVLCTFQEEDSVNHSLLIVKALHEASLDTNPSIIVKAVSHNNADLLRYLIDNCHMDLSWKGQTEDTLLSLAMCYEAFNVLPLLLDSPEFSHVFFRQENKKYFFSADGEKWFLGAKDDESNEQIIYCIREHMAKRLDKLLPEKAGKIKKGKI